MDGNEKEKKTNGLKMKANTLHVSAPNMSLRRKAGVWLIDQLTRMACNVTYYFQIMGK